MEYTNDFLSWIFGAMEEKVNVSKYEIQLFLSERLLMM